MRHDTDFLIILLVIEQLRHPCRLLDYTAHHWAVAASSTFIILLIIEQFWRLPRRSFRLYCSSLSSCRLPCRSRLFILYCSSLSSCRFPCRSCGIMPTYLYSGIILATPIVINSLHPHSLRMKNTFRLYCSSLSGCRLRLVLCCSSLSSWRLPCRSFRLYCSSLSSCRLLIYTAHHWAVLATSTSLIYVAHLDYTAHHWAVVDLHVVLAYLDYTARHWAVIGFHVALTASMPTFFIVALSLPLPHSCGVMLLRKAVWDQLASILRRHRRLVAAACRLRLYCSSLSSCGIDADLILYCSFFWAVAALMPTYCRPSWPTLWRNVTFPLL